MSSNLDGKLASDLAIAISLNPRANLQQIARRAGISKATLYRIAPTREAVVELLMERAANHLEEALDKADLATPPFADALGRLSNNVIRERAFFIFWHSAQWLRLMDTDQLDDNAASAYFFDAALEEFFLRGQKAGAFRVDMPAKWLVKSYDYLLFAAAESAERGEIASVGMAAMVDKTFLAGVAEAGPVSGT